MILFDSEKKCVFLKKIGADGISIPNYNSIPFVLVDKNFKTQSEIFSDCPSMTLWLEVDSYRLICWDWTPGPGPGDFELNFKDENSAIEFVESYYFGENEYFEKRLEYEMNKNSS